jgi:kynurenine/2-aminoadipate aminotransferase
MISLGGGMPNPSLFPFRAVSFTTDDGTELKPSSKDLEEALQYSQTAGLPELVNRLKRFQDLEHAPQRPVDIIVTPGSQDGLAKLFDMLVEDGPDGSILVESPTYSGSLAYLHAKGCNLVGVPTDASGLDPRLLDKLLCEWDQNNNKKHNNKPKPRILYTIPTGSNPTGATMPLDRRLELLRVASAHNLLIIEDDPYYYMTFDSDARKPGRSLLALDTEGRVIRTDSFSKVLSSGLRLGMNACTICSSARVLLVPTHFSVSLCV